MRDDSGTVAGEELLRGLYQILFGREPDCAEMRHCFTQIAKGSNPADVAASLMESQEFQSLRMSDEQFVTALYRIFLDRFPSREDGTAAWITFVHEKGRPAAIRAFRHGEEVTNRLTDFRWAFPDMSRFGNGRIEIRDGGISLKLTLGNAPEGLEIDEELWISMRPLLERVGLFGLVRVGNELTGSTGTV
jgi:hypothetical protein